MAEEVIRIKKIYLFLLIFAVLLKLSLTAFFGHYGDLFLFQKWGNFLLKHSPTEIYTETDCNLPPLWVYFLWGFSHFHFFVTGKLISITSEIFKIPAVLADLAIGLLIFHLLLKERVKEGLAFGASMLFILNPFILYNSSIWGQLDSIYVLFAFLSFIFIEQKKIYLSAVFLALSSLIKLQALMFLPLFIFILFKNHPFKKILGAWLIFILTMIIVLLPFLINKISPYFIFEKTWLASWNQPRHLSLNAFNIWWIPQLIFLSGAIDYPVDFFYDQPSPISVSVFSLLRIVGLIIFSFFYFLIFLNRRKNIFLLAGLVALSFFMLPVGIHERYHFAFFAFFSLVWPKEKKYLLPFLIFSLTSFLNLILGTPFDFTIPILLKHFILIASPFLTILNCLTFIYLFFLLFKERLYETPIPKLKEN